MSFHSRDTVYFRLTVRQIDKCPNYRPDFRSRCGRPEVDNDMNSTVSVRAESIYNTVIKNQVRDLIGSIRILAKTVLGVIYPPPLPV
jgi:hypothetical protein